MPGVTQVSQVAREQKHLEDAIAWLAVFPELGKRHQHTMREHDRLLSSPEHILNEGIHTFPRFLREPVIYVLAEFAFLCIFSPFWTIIWPPLSAKVKNLLFFRLIFG